MRSLSTIAVIGATGTAGTRVVARLKARDVAVVEISRARGVDVVSGRGLYEALDGVDVVIDVADPLPPDGRSDVVQTVVTATQNVVGACAAREVQRLVLVTIAAIDDPVFDGFPYFEAKRAAKEIILASQVPATIVKSTQWYEFATHPVAVSSQDGEVVVEDWLIQPIAADTVADVLVEAALAQTHPPRTIAGPRPMRLPELASKLLASQGDSRRVRTVRPALGALGTGALLAPGGAIVIGPDVDTWLHRLAPARADGASADDGSESPAGLRARNLSKI